MTQILNYGGGMQTIAMCVLVATSTLPKPDAVIAADTGREVQSTWAYAETYARPLLASVGLPLHIAPHSLSTVDVYGKNNDLLMPVYTATGKLPTYCSTEWKARAVNRYARQELGIIGSITNWIGFSFDERRRVKGEAGRRFPLIDLMLTRADCERIVLDAGLPLPRKSRCEVCPHQHPAEWLEVYDDPAAWARACALDEELRANDERGGVWLHESRRPLRDLTRADLLASTRREPDRQCGLGMCFV